MDINHTTVAGNTAITSAAEKGHLEMAKYLLSKGADLYKKHGSGRLAFHQAATSGRTEMVGYLLDQGMPVDLELGNLKVAPLALACERGHIDTVVLLLERGANPNKVIFYLLSSIFFFSSPLLLLCPHLWLCCRKGLMERSPSSSQRRMVI